MSEQQLTKEFLETSLRKYTSDPSLEIVDHDVTAGSQKGDNYTSAIYSIVVSTRTKTDDSVKKFHLIAKIAHIVEGKQDISADFQLFEKELKVYNEILEGDMISLQKSIGIAKPIKPPAPKIITQVGDHDTIILFENLREKGFTMGNKTTGLDRDHCLLVMQGLAKIHGLSYAAKKHAGKSISEMYPLLTDWRLEGPMSEMSTDMFYNVHKGATEVVACASNRKYAHYAERMKKMNVDIKQVVRTMVKDEEWNVLCHGDSWVNNMMFRYNKDGSPNDVNFIDFQVSESCCPTLDLTYFFYTSTTRETRLLCLQECLQKYVDTFHSTLNFCGEKWPGLTVEKLKNYFVRDSLFGYYMGMFVLPFILSNSENAVDLMDIEKDESIGDGFTRKCYEATVNLKGNTVFEKRAIEIIEDMIEYGQM